MWHYLSKKIFFSWKMIGINVVLYSPNQIHRYIGPYLKMFNCLKKEAACYPETSVIFTTLHSIMSLKRYFSKLPPSEFHITLKITQQTFFFFFYKVKVIFFFFFFFLNLILWLMRGKTPPTGWGHSWILGPTAQLTLINENLEKQKWENFHGNPELSREISVIGRFR